MTGKLGDIFNMANTAVDPVCKMQVDTQNPRGGTAEHQGVTYYFCAPGCQRAFTADPEQYLRNPGPAPHPHP